MSFIDTLNKLLGDPNEKELKKLRPLVKKVRDLELSDAYQALTLEDLPKKTEEFKKRIADGETVDDLLVEAFALVCRACPLLEGREVSLGKQTFVWNMVSMYDVQIIGGAALHKGMIAEMRTGEGKTLVCTMPVYLNALTGKGVHVVTVNDYLARRDSLWMGVLYEALGLTVGTIIHDLEPENRKAAYDCDITYGTNNEFGFDYLRDNMSSQKDHQVQRGLHYAIVDEVDSILIDEARTPLIISQPADESTQKYGQYASLVKQLQENDHYNRDEKQRTATLTEDGVHKMEQLLGVDNIYTDKGFEAVHHIEQALRAHAIYEQDIDYVVRDGEVIIVDEFTGRLMPGRRYGHGLHQAIEAKEGVEVQRESKTLATITFQNYFRLFEKLAGMTGTAKTEEEEFENIYGLRTLVIPTNKPIARIDRSDAIYRTVEAKFRAVAKAARERHERGQAVLIGTVSIEKSEALSRMLKEEGIDHSILNAKHHEQEAEIVADAGRPGAVTIATNMAGRGTDIKLGEGVAEAGGLCVLGTERHESRRIDNQLRGRSGRQGDPGESQFFVSMEDDLMRLFGGDRLKNMMERLNIPDDVPLENRVVSRSILGAQKRVEGRNFDIRKHVVQYDDVMNKHREIIYVRRQDILNKLDPNYRAGVILSGDEGRPAGPKGPDGPEDEIKGLHDDIVESMKREAASIAAAHAVGDDSANWDAAEIVETMAALHPAFTEVISQDAVRSFESSAELSNALADLLGKFYDAKCNEETEEVVQRAERIVTLRSIDTHWMDHIDDMAHLREQVAFAGYAQKDPLIEYKDQGFQRFRELLAAIDSTIVRTLLQADFSQFAAAVFLERAQDEMDDMVTNQDALEENPVFMPQEQGGDIAAVAAQRVQAQASRSVKKVGRNDPCPCGSGKKYKHCCGK